MNQLVTVGEVEKVDDGEKGAYNLAVFLKNKSGLPKPEVYNGTKESIPTLLNNRTGIIFFESFVEENIQGQSVRSS